MHPLVRRIARTILPDGLRSWRADRWRECVTRATDRLTHVAAGRVLGGPFRGMRYVTQAHSSQLGPKLLGTYEIELVDTIESILAMTSLDIVDVGAAEGYYAVGLLVRHPEARCLAFEGSAEARRDLVSLAALNGVTDRLDVGGFATSELLERALQDRPRAVVIVDVDGGELAVVDPVAVPSLARAMLMVELHPHLLPDVQATLRTRLAGTHDLQYIGARDREDGQLPTLVGFSRRQVLALAWEARPDDQGWLVATPRLTPFAQT